MAQKLARNAAERSEAALGQAPLPEPLTVQQLAEDYETSPIRINTWIKECRIDLFGRDLTDSAIDYRRRTERKRHPRTCEHPGCAEELPAEMHANRRYCDNHRTTVARVRRHRGTPMDAAIHRRRRRPTASRPPSGETRERLRQLADLDPAAAKRLSKALGLK